MNYYALIYTVMDDYLERRPQYRPHHLQLAQQAHARGELLLGGALGDAPTRALLVFRADNAFVAETFAQNDPYVQNGLVQSWEVQPWIVVVGNEPQG
jgi:uncharacterized protein YciI